MKKLYSLLAILISTFFISVFSQEIPNGGFEDWDQGIWTNNPVNWSTDNTEVSAPVFQDTSAYSGDFAMTLVPDADGLGEGDATSETTIDIEYIPEALEFYARWNYVAGQVGVTITFYNELTEVISENWSPEDFQSESDWQLIQMPLLQIEPIITHCVIRCYAEVGDLATASISFDDMQFGTINSINETPSLSIKIGPNPVSDYLNIELAAFEYENTKMYIIDYQGKVIYEGDVVNGITVSSFTEGFYILGIEVKGSIHYEKFTVRR